MKRFKRFETSLFSCASLSYVWFLESTKERKKVLRKMVYLFIFLYFYFFYVQFHNEKYKRK